MKKVIFSLLFMLTAVYSWAQTGLGANQRVIGHTVSEEWDYAGVMFGQAGTYTVGAVLYPQQLSFYKGCKVVGMRLAAAVDLGRTKVFVKNATTGKEIFTQTQRIYGGEWNNIFFNDDPYTITGEESLFYGFDYVETDEMIENEAGGIVCMQNASTGGFMVEQNGTLYPTSGVGNLCVQLIVDTSALPAHNMTVTLLDAGFKYKPRTEQLDLFFMLMNVGREPIENYTVAVQIDGGEPQTFLVEEEKPVEAGATTTWEKYLDIPKDLAIGTHTITGYVTEINGKAAPDPDKTKVSTSFALYDEFLDRERVLVEVYSSQMNPYSALLDEVMDEVRTDMPDKTAFVQVHAPGTGLAITDAEWLHNLYAYTLPTFTINRAYFPGEAHVAYDMNDYLGFLPTGFLTAMVEDMVDQDYYNPAFADIKLEGSYNEATRKLDVAVSGKALPEAKAIYGDMALTLMLVQDDVRSRQTVVSGQTTKPDLTYTHDNVLFGFMTSSRGDAIKLENDTYSAKYTTVLDEDIDPEKVRVIGFLTKAGAATSEEDAKDYDVINCSMYEIGELSGILDIEAASEKEIESVYTLDGLRLDKETANTPGFRIIRYTDGSAAKVLVK